MHRKRGMHTKCSLKKHKKKRALGRQRHRWGKNIKINLKETEYKHTGSVHLALDMI
jgi:hypothetical protein